MTQHQAQCLLKVRDALEMKDYNEAYHWLYQIASPNFDKYSGEVWKDIERIAASTDSKEDENWKEKFEYWLNNNAWINYEKSKIIISYVERYIKPASTDSKEAAYIKELEKKLVDLHEAFIEQSDLAQKFMKIDFERSDSKEAIDGLVGALEIILKEAKMCTAHTSGRYVKSIAEKAIANYKLFSGNKNEQL